MIGSVPGTYSISIDCVVYIGYSFLKFRILRLFLYSLCSRRRRNDSSYLEIHQRQGKNLNLFIFRHSFKSQIVLKIDF